MRKPLVKGDYVLATKYSDGDPYDGYCVGFFDSIPAFATDRFMVVDSKGKPYRASGFRRCERISHALGSWIVQHRVAIEALTHAGEPVNMWRFKYGGPAERLGLERWAADEGAVNIVQYCERNQIDPATGERLPWPSVEAVANLIKSV